MEYCRRTLEVDNKVYIEEIVGMWIGVIWLMSANLCTSALISVCTEQSRVLPFCLCTFTEISTAFTQVLSKSRIILHDKLCLMLN